MKDNSIIDARGLSCPQPVMLTSQAISKIQKGTLEVLVDSGTARDNVSRLAQKNHWLVTVTETAPGNYRLVLQK